MEYTLLGESELEVSRICLGTCRVGADAGGDDVDGAVRTALDLGINFFDTGPSCDGSRGPLAGALLDEVRTDRGSLALVAKGGVRWEGDGGVRDAGREFLWQGLERTLEELGTDHVDLFQVQWPDPRTPPEVTAHALQEMVEKGLARCVGVGEEQ